MQYGTFSATLKSAVPGGAVTAVIIADCGDEIDVEIVGGKQKRVVTTSAFLAHTVTILLQYAPHQAQYVFANRKKKSFELLKQTFSFLVGPTISTAKTLSLASMEVFTTSQG